MTLADGLADWTPLDAAQYVLGRTLGLFEDQTFEQVKDVFWTDNPVGQALYDTLLVLAGAGVLQHRDAGDDELRWNPDGPDGRVAG